MFFRRFAWLLLLLMLVGCSKQQGRPLVIRWDGSSQRYIPMGI